MLPPCQVAMCIQYPYACRRALWTIYQTSLFYSDGARRKMLRRTKCGISSFHSSWNDVALISEGQQSPQPRTKHTLAHPAGRRKSNLRIQHHSEQLCHYHHQSGMASWRKNKPERGLARGAWQAGRMVQLGKGHFCSPTYPQDQLKSSNLGSIPLSQGMTLVIT